MRRSVPHSSTLLTKTCQADVVHTIFERRAGEFPDAIAVIAEGKSLTFGELDQLANRLANRLVRQGIRPETRVGICAEASLSLIVAILGVLKAGGAYVPLDPHYPRQRLLYLLTDSAVPAVITEARLASTLTGMSAGVIELDSPWQMLSGEPDTAPPVSVSPEGAVCVIYTSGSSGSPKGVCITHAGLVNLATAAAQEFGLHRGDRFLQLASISFSAALEEIFPVLLSGGTLVLAGYQRAIPTMEHFLRLLARERITGFEITTSSWHQLVDELATSETRLPDSLRFVVMGGDRARADAVLAWRGLGIPLIHVYGPTEATATGTYYHTAKEDLRPDGLLPIGRAIPNTAVHLLDDAMSPVAAGAVGEVFIGGRALARCYHGASGRTAAQFVPDPTGPVGTRLYRTGDLARQLPDGTILFAGRTDHQVKIRGYRIEPGEIEAALELHPSVGTAVVTTSSSQQDDKYLVAHVTQGNGPKLDEDDLRAHLTAMVPGYMVPAVFAVLDALPLTANGKVNHAALRACPPPRAHGSEGTDSPRPGTESELAMLWSDVLRCARVGSSEEFYALGGDSLQAARIVAKARRHFDVDLLVGDLLNAPTVRSMSARIDHLRRSGQTARAPSNDEQALKRWRDKRRLLERSLASRANHPRASLIAPSQRSLWFLSRTLPGVPLFNDDWQCTLTGVLDLNALRAALGAIIQRHEVLRTRFDVLEGEPVQVIDEPGEVPLYHYPIPDNPVADRRGDVERMRDELTAATLDPGKQHLLELHVFAVTRDEHLLLCRVHHLVWDGVSKEVFLDELAAFYEAFRAGTTPVVSDLPLQYGDFALCQRQYLVGPALERLVAYWRQQLDGSPAVLNLPSDRPAPRTPDYTGATLLRPLPADLARRVHEVAQREKVTRFVLLITVMLSQLCRRTGETDLCVGTPAANRDWAGIDGLLGCFITSLPIRVRFQPGMTYQQAMESVQIANVGAIEHQRLPLDMLIEALRPERLPGRSPLFQVWFAAEDERSLARELTGLDLRDFESIVTGLPSQTAKLELMWRVVDRGDQMVLSLTYRTSMFDSATVAGMADEYLAILEDLMDDPQSSFVPPLKEMVREKLLTIWREAFQGNQLGIRDDFFSLGGHSMLAVQLVMAIQDQFGVELSFTDFFEHPTVEELTDIITTSLGDRDQAYSPPAATQSLADILAGIDGETSVTT